VAPRREGDDIVAQLAVGDAAFWVARAGAAMNRLCPTAIRGTTARFLLVVDNPDAIMITAVAAGGIESSPVSASMAGDLGESLIRSVTNGKSGIQSARGPQYEPGPASPAIAR